MRHLRSGNTNVQPGDFDTPAEFFTMEEISVEGALKRTPALAYSAMVNHAAFQSFEQRDSDRKVGQIWSIISMRWVPSRVPLEGMRIVLKTTGEEFEITGVRHVDGARKKIECTARLFR